VLIVLGVFMVNAEDGFNQQAMPISIHAWSLLFYIAVFLVWGVLRFDNVAITRMLRGVGVALIVALGAMYRGGADGHSWMAPQWWGILGLIGWATFFSSEFYLLSRGKLGAVLGFLVFCVVYYALAHSGGLESRFGWFFSQEPHAAHSEIVLAGVACALIFFDATRSDSNRLRFVEVLVFAVALASRQPSCDRTSRSQRSTPRRAGAVLRAISVGVFSAAVLAHRRERARALDALGRARASSPRVTYLIPFVVEAVLSLAGFALPAALRSGPPASCGRRSIRV